MNLEERMARFQEADLYVVITEEFCKGRSPLHILEQVLEAGVKLVQLREKHMTDRGLLLRALEFCELCHSHGALLIVDDRVDIALASAADGVHVGQDDLPVQVVRSLATDLIIGCSTHSLHEAVAAQEAGARYVNIGPIFSTQTKIGTTSPLGAGGIDLIAPHLTIPWTVMGGIKEANIGQVLERGALRVAVVTAVTAADDVKTACTSLRQSMIAARGRRSHAVSTPRSS
jgi:thiamine-phosphate pyrophosphorylase